MNTRRSMPMSQALVALALMALLPKGVCATEQERTWVGGVELPDRYFFFVAQIDIGTTDAAGTLHLVDGERFSVGIETCTTDSVRLSLQADGTTYILAGHAVDGEVVGSFFPEDNEATTFPFQMTPMHRMRLETLELFEGTYVFEDDSRLTVKAVAPGYLRTYAPQRGRFHNLYPVSEDEFLQASDLLRPGDEVRFTFGAGALEHETKGRARRIEEQPRAFLWSQDQTAAVVTLTDEIRIHMLRVSGRAFDMGARMTAKDAEHLFGFDGGTIKGMEYPPRPTQITTDYWLGRSEVTNAQFRIFIEDDAYVTTAELEGSGLLWIDGEFKRVPGASWRHPGRETQPNEPVAMVSWNDANAFCAWLSRRTGREFRLPNEAEWEYASQAGGNSLYGHGDDPATLEKYAWFSANAAGRAHEVETLAPNAWGFYDLHGNVWEWCADWYAPIEPTIRAVDPAGPSNGEAKVIRGGSWLNGAFDCRSSYRAHDDPGLAEPHFGFRVCATDVGE